MTVTAARTEQRLGDIPASVNVLDREEIRRRRPSWPTTCCGRCRRSACSAGRAACRRIPTAQGVSLRGIGPSGVSRTLVLLDGMPFNDPFGGWVYWTRVPLESVDRIEVVDGSSSSLYGNYAMGGVINIVTSRRRGGRSKSSTQYGNLGSPKFDFFAQRRLGQGRRGGRGQRVRHGWLSRSSSPSERGPGGQQGDRRLHATSASSSNTAPTGRSARSSGAATSREERDNGKASTIDGTAEANDTTLDVRQRRRARPAARRERPAGARLHRLRDVPQQLPGGAGRHVPPRSIGRMTLESDACRRTASAAWCSGRGRSATRHFFTRRHRLALGRRRQRGGCASTPVDRRRRVDAAPRFPAARSEASACSCRTSSRRRRS